MALTAAEQAEVTTLRAELSKQRTAYSAACKRGNWQEAHVSFQRAVLIYLELMTYSI